MKFQITKLKLGFLPLLLGLVLAGEAYRIAAAGGVLGTASSTANNLRQPVSNANGLVTWYPLDGDSKDYSSNGNNGNATNFTFDGISNGWTGGKFGKGLKFNGASTAIYSTTLFSDPEVFSLALWFNTSYSGSIMGFEQNQSGTSPNHDRGLFLDQNGKLDFAVFNGAVNGIISPATYLDGQWHFAVAELSPTGMFLYVDGSNVASNASIISAQAYAGYWRVGYWNVGGFNYNTPSYFNGSLDDVRIYNRALSTIEVNQLYAGSMSQNCDQSCRIWLKFDDNLGTVAKDSVGTFSGTLNGASSWTTGNFASAVRLNGSTDYVSVPNLTLSSGTVDIWINPVLVSGDQRLFTQAAGASTQAGQLALNQTTGENGSLWVFDGTAWQRLSADGAIKAGQWNQIVVTNNGGTATAYVNGTQALTAASAFNFSGVAANIGGKFLGTTGGTFNGAVDDFRIYTRMLSPEEVAEQWRLGT